MRFRFSVRGLLLLVLIIGLSLWALERIELSRKSSKYSRRADSCEFMERRCREIVAMDPATRRQAAIDAYDDPYLDNPEWTRLMIGHFEGLKNKYRRAAENPHIPVPPDPKNP
jgi:hypothetical protein